MASEHNVSGVDANALTDRNRAADHYTEVVLPRLRDVLPTIFQVVDERSTLCAAMLVCRDWADAAATELWRSCYSACTLRVPAARRQIYAAKIRELKEAGFPPEHALGGGSGAAAPVDESLAGLSFPRVRKLHLNHYTRCCRRVPSGQACYHTSDGRDAEAPPLLLLPPPRFPAEFIGPRLASLTCYDGDLFMADMQARLAQVQPPLRELRLTRSLSYSRMRRWPQHDPLLHVLPLCGPHTLESLMFIQGVEITSAALAHLAARQTLRSLYVETVDLPSSVIRGALALLARDDECVPFASLWKLEVYTDWNGVALIAGMGLPEARELVLQVRDPHGTVRLAALAACLANGNLRSLRIMLVASLPLTGGDIVAALSQPSGGSTSQLRALLLQDGRGRNVVVPGFGDRQLTALVAALPLLERLDLVMFFGEGLTTAAIRIVGEHCKRLRRLCMRQRVDMHELPCPAETTSPMFPELTYLRLHSPKPGEPYWASTAPRGSTCECHCPTCDPRVDDEGDAIEAPGANPEASSEEGLAFWQSLVVEERKRAAMLRQLQRFHAPKLSDFDAL